MVVTVEMIEVLNAIKREISEEKPELTGTF